MPDAHGNGRLIAERPELATAPEAVQITIEPSSGSSSPSGSVVASWERGGK